MESMESREAGFPPFPHSLEIPSGLAPSPIYDLDYRMAVLALAIRIHGTPTADASLRIDSARLKLLQFVAQRPGLMPVVTRWATKGASKDSLLGSSQRLRRGYPFERVARFTCSDPFLTQLWGICARSLEILSEDSYVDCADRERVEWTDDSPPAFDCTRVMMRGPDEDTGAKRKTYWSDSRLLRGLLRRIALTQQLDGQLKAHSCSERFDIHAIMEDRSCDWVVLLRQYFELGRCRSCE